MNAMKKLFSLLIVVLLLLVVIGVASATPPDSKNFVSPMSGRDEVPARDTLARGNAVFHLNDAGTELSYKLIVANIDNVVASHIHCGVPGVSAPVGMTLFGGGVPGSGRVDGVIAQGVKTAPDANNACGWVTLADVITAMRSGNAYVNVHTNDGVAPTNTGPGDFPGGEIRGQIQENGPSR
jgi:hypothetical protein